MVKVIARWDKPVSDDKFKKGTTVKLGNKYNIKGTFDGLGKVDSSKIDGKKLRYDSEIHYDTDTNVPIAVTKNGVYKLKEVKNPVDDTKEIVKEVTSNPKTFLEKYWLYLLIAIVVIYIIWKKA